jgi:hypothetical protein
MLLLFLLLLRLRCSMLRDVLSSLSASSAAGVVFLSMLSDGKKSLVSMDKGVNVCSARATSGKGEEAGGDASEAMAAVEVEVGCDTGIGENGDTESGGKGL